MQLSKQDTATVLAALRYWQSNIVERSEAFGDDIAPYNLRGHFDDAMPLDAEEIDALCERINFDKSEDSGFYGFSREEFDSMMQEQHEGVSEETLDMAWESIVGSNSEVVADCIKDVMDVAVDFAKPEEGTA